METTRVAFGLVYVFCAFVIFTHNMTLQWVFVGLEYICLAVFVHGVFFRRRTPARRR